MPPLRHHRAETADHDPQAAEIGEAAQRVGQDDARARARNCPAAGGRNPGRRRTRSARSWSPSASTRRPVSAQGTPISQRRGRKGRANEALQGDRRAAPIRAAAPAPCSAESTSATVTSSVAMIAARIGTPSMVPLTSASIGPSRGILDERASLPPASGRAERHHQRRDRERRRAWKSPTRSGCSPIAFGTTGVRNDA